MEIADSFNMAWSNCSFNLKQELPNVYDDFSFPPLLPPLDYSGILGATGFEFEMSDPFYLPSLDLHLPHLQTLFPEVFFFNYGIGEGLPIQAELQPQLQQLDVFSEEKNRGVRKWREEKEDDSESTIKSKKLSRKMISQYFYMPITQAARELNVGLTLLKKKCRELGIRRWPHRKLISLQTLIKNVQEYGREEGEGSLQDSLEILEHERRVMEEIPDMQLEAKTKRLRQTYFKANYKKRKRMGMINDSSSENVASSSGCNAAAPHENFCGLDEDEEFKYFFSDCFSSGSSF